MLAKSWARLSSRPLALSSSSLNCRLLKFTRDRPPECAGKHEQGRVAGRTGMTARPALADQSSQALEHDRALSLHWHLRDPSLLDRLDLPTPRNAARARVRSLVLTEAAVIGHAEPGRSISYSRRRDAYTDQQRYRGSAYSYRNVVGEIDLMAHLGECPRLRRTSSRATMRCPP